MTRPHPRDPVEIDVELVARLIADQFPAWAELPLEPVEADGHDNRSFRLGHAMSVRVPSGEAYAAHVMTEQLWLPRLAPHLPLPIPVPLALGEPARALPWRWSINTWLEGETATVERIADLARFAGDLAAFLNALRSLDTLGAPPPGPDNFFRGGALTVYDGEARRCIEELRDLVDARQATKVWEAALGATWRGPPVWVHGDVAAGNLLARNGRLCAVIDFGQSAVGDPACDLTIAWTLLSGESREAFRSQLAVDEATWVRGRGWGLWKALLQLREQRHGQAVEAARSQRTLAAVLAEHP
jgi:aminoglycoside phosphotransferase (APT) family kinase protein